MCSQWRERERERCVSALQTMADRPCKDEPFAQWRDSGTTASYLFLANERRTCSGGIITISPLPCRGLRGSSPSLISRTTPALVISKKVNDARTSRGKLGACDEQQDTQYQLNERLVSVGTNTQRLCTMQCLYTTSSTGDDGSKVGMRHTTRVIPSRTAAIVKTSSRGTSNDVFSSGCFFFLFVQYVTCGNWLVGGWWYECHDRPGRLAARQDE